MALLPILYARFDLTFISLFSVIHLHYPQTRGVHVGMETFLLLENVSITTRLNILLVDMLFVEYTL